MTIIATVNFGKNQVTQAWDFIEHDEMNNEDAILILTSFKNGDLVGIPLAANRIKKVDGIEAAQFIYDGIVDASVGELIKQCGKAN